MAHLRDWVNVLIEDFKAWRRGEKRVAPRFVHGHMVRGRVYAPKSPASKPTDASNTEAKSEPIVDMQAIHRGPDGEIKGVYHTSNRR